MYEAYCRESQALCRARFATTS